MEDTESDTKTSDERPEEDPTPDFSTLPSVVWVDIMTYLSIRDRYMVSQTCHCLYDVFNHPSLWSKMVIKYIGNPSLFYESTPTLPAFQQEVVPLKSKHDKGTLKVTEKHLDMISRFGPFFQKLTISVIGFLHTDFGQWNDILSRISKECRLESLSLEIGTITTDMHLYGNDPAHKNVTAIVDFIRNAFRLKSFHLISWPLYPSTLGNHEENIFEALMENSKLNDLESLSLFWPQEKRKWSQRTPRLIPCEYVERMVSHFQNLSCLALRSPLINENVLVEFCRVRKAKLKTLRIFVIYNQHEESYGIPEVSSRVWDNIRRTNPELSVEVTVMSRVPNMELFNLLSLHCPLTHIKFMKYARCDEQLMSSLCDKYRSTLRVFECFADVEDTALTKLVSVSEHLAELEVTSQIHYTTVINLAKVRGSKWRKFIFEEISFDDNDESIYDENDTIARDENGELVLVAVARFHKAPLDDEKRGQRLLEMCEEVSRSLTFSWKPRDKTPD